MKYSNQEIFDKVVERLYDGTGRSVDEDSGACQYLSEDGLKCAVGIFIPDGHPAQELDDIGVLNFLELYDDLYFVNPSNIHMFIEFQRTHDNPCNWVGKMFVNDIILKSMASKYGLEFNKPQKDS